MQFLARHRVAKVEAHSMQIHTLRLRGQSVLKDCRSVFFVPHNRMVKVRKMHSYLIFPPLTSSLRTPKILVKEFCYFLMPCHKHGLCIDILI